MFGRAPDSEEQQSFARKTSGCQLTSQSWHSICKPNVCTQVLTLLNDRHLDVRVLAQLISAAQAGRASASDDNITLCVLIQVLRREHASSEGSAKSAAACTNGALMLMLDVQSTQGHRQASQGPPCLPLLSKRAGSN